MNFRPSKITKFFPIESSTDPYRFFPRANKQPQPEEVIPASQPSPPKLSVSTFDHIPIALVTFYDSSNTTLYYSLYINNLRNKSIFSKIIDIENQIIGDLQAFIECLQYIIYNPIFFQNINKQKIVIYTNSTNISNIFKPFSNLISDTQYSKAYFKIQGLLKCIKNIFIEFLDIHQYPCSEAYKLLKLNIENMHNE